MSHEPFRTGQNALGEEILRLEARNASLQRRNTALKNGRDLQKRIISGLEAEIQECQGIARHVSYVDWMNAKLDYEAES